jgi:hypothetical protein
MDFDKSKLPHPLTVIRNNIHLPTPVAVWVLTAHVIALSFPFLLLYSVCTNWEFVSSKADNPYLIFAAMAAMTMSGAFEVAQNNFDNWYLNPDCGSTMGSGMCDFLFYTMGSVSFALLIAAFDSHWIVTSVSVCAIVGTVYLYLTKGDHHSMSSIQGLSLLRVLWNAFGNPVVFLQLLSVIYTMFFFFALIKTKNQVLHGFVGLISGAGLSFVSLAVELSAQGIIVSWTVVVAIFVAALLIAKLLNGYISKLPATPLLNEQTKTK